MNRKDRRAERAKQRQGEGAPPAYYEQIERAGKLVFEWVHAQPAPPDLRWVEQKDDGVFIAAALDVGARYLADSPDAFALLAWLDEQTGRKLTLNQALWALRRCRALPMPDGSYFGVSTSHESGAYKALLHMADRIARHDEADRIAGSPCGHCGKELDAASAVDGHKPRPGDLSVCVYCCGINGFDAELRLAALSGERLDALPSDAVQQIREMQGLMRAAHAKAWRGTGGPAGES